MTWAVVAGTLAVTWWCSWLLVHARLTGRGGSQRLAGLLAYEFVALPFVVVGLAVLGLAPAVQGVESKVPVAVSAAAGAVVGVVAWAALTGLSGLKDLRRPRSRRRLVTGIAVSGWSAVAEEVIFRGLLLLALSQTIGPWAAAALSALAFGAHHVPVAGLRGGLLHTASGAVFAGAAVAGLGLVGAVTAHVTYNVMAATVREGLLAAAVAERSRTPLRTMSP